MPNTQNVRAQEHHTQAEHAHDVGAASHDQRTTLSGNEEMKQADEHNREKQEHLAQQAHDADHAKSEK